MFAFVSVPFPSYFRPSPYVAIEKDRVSPCTLEKKIYHQMVACFHIYISPPSEVNDSMLRTFPPPCFFRLIYPGSCSVVVIVMKFTPGHSCPSFIVWMGLNLLTLPYWWTLGYFSSFTMTNSAVENTFGYFLNDFSFLTSWKLNVYDLTLFMKREKGG